MVSKLTLYLTFLGIPYVKSISKLDDGEHESRGSERWVKEKLEEIAFKIQDQNYDECAKLFDILTENVPPHKDKLVSLIDEAYSSYVNDLSRSIMMSGSEKHIKALIIWDAKITAKSFLFYQSSLLRINLQKIDTTNKPAKQFEDELTTFTNHMILTKKNYIKLFSEDNQLLVDSIENSVIF